MINLFVRRLLKCRLMNRNLIPLLNALKKTGVQSKKKHLFQIKRRFQEILEVQKRGVS